MDSCYACNQKATSHEHVPPRCIFPELKDYPHKNFRKSLVTVPSCDDHNSKKSKDDEFLMVALAGMLGNNSIGYIHSITKVNRALRRTSFRLLDKVFVANRQEFQINIGNNRFINAIAGTPDLERLKKCFEYIARGIYRHHHQRTFFGKVKSIESFLIVKDDSRKQLQRFLLDRARRDILWTEPHGENPDVFCYEIIEPDEFGLELVGLKFYGHIEIYCAMIPEGIDEPNHLGFELMKRGMPVTFTIDEKEYPVHIEKIV